MEKCKERINVDEVSIREMVDSDLEEINCLWKSGEWNYGISLLRFITDPQCCENKAFLAIYKGDIVGTGMAYILNEDIGSLGGLFVKPACRNLGIGQKIWDVMMCYLGDRNVISNTMSRRVKKNVSLGFTHFIQDFYIYTGIPNSDNYDYNFEEFKNDVDKMVPIQDADFEELVAFDTSLVKEVDRRNYLKVAIQKYKIRGHVAYKDDVIVGYVGEVPSDNFAIISPWYSKCPRVAKALMNRFLSDLPRGIPVELNVPHSNENALAIAEELGLNKEDLMKCHFNKHPYTVEWGFVYSIINAVMWLW